MVEHYKWKSYDFDSSNSVEIFNLFKDEPFVFFLDSSLPRQQSRVTAGLGGISLHEVPKSKIPRPLGHGASQTDPQGRFSFIGFDPFYIFQDKGNNSLEDLRTCFQRYASYFQERTKDIPVPLFSGMVGYLGYDLGLRLEKIKLQAQDDLLIPDCFFGFYDCVIAIDHLAHKLYIISTGLPEKNPSLIERRAEERLAKITRKLSKYSIKNNEIFSFDSPPLSNGENFDLDLSCNFTQEMYFKTVKRALEYIRNGDIYQVNLAQRFLFDTTRHDFEINSTDLYNSLRRLSPSNFSGYLDCGDFQILSSSPERFLKLSDGIVETRPMKGTRARGQSLKEDKRLKREILSSKKDKAELLMITDLERNDLGRVCRYGSIKVRKMRTLEEYKTVFQTTSTVTGILQKNKDCFDVIEACFPGGSVTGCPKIRAMEIIEELEPTRRAFYTGSMGYINFCGEMDFNVLIRTLLVKDEKIFFHVGSGIVADSTPEDEYEETLIKSKALRQAISAVLHSKIEV